MELTLDLSKTGLEMFFKPYQIATFESLWEQDDYLSSREVWKQVNDILPRTLSRASIINFLNASVDQGLLNFKETTGKGGYRRLYTPKYSKDESKQYLSNIVKEKLKSLE